MPALVLVLAPALVPVLVPALVPASVPALVPASVRMLHQAATETAQVSVLQPYCAFPVKEITRAQRAHRFVAFVDHKRVVLR